VRAEGLTSHATQLMYLTAWAKASNAAIYTILQSKHRRHSFTLSSSTEEVWISL